MEKSLSQKVVCLKYFSRFAELTGKTTEEYSTRVSSVEELWYELDKQYSFGQPISTVRPAINHQFCDWQSSINDGDLIGFIPPVSGG